MSLNALYLLIGTFALVFCLGLQSQLVNNGHFISAFVNSVAISSAHLVLYKLTPNASGWEIAAFLSGGPFGIVCSMVFYRWHYADSLTPKKRAEAFMAGFAHPINPIDK